MDDPFDDLLNLEEQYYEEGYQQGYEDGQKQSRLEARLFGIEKGFEKFVAMGKLQARARIWAARLEAGRKLHIQNSSADTSGAGNSLGALPSFYDNARLEKHMTTLLALVDPSALSLDNTDDAVADFDDRMKRAQAKEKIIERIIGDEGVNGKISIQQTDRSNATFGDMESFGSKS